MKTSIFNRVFIKLFFVTALTFSTLLIGALFVQSFYFNRTYTLVKQQTVVRDYANLTAELERTSGSPENIFQILQKYKSRNSLEGVIFSKNGLIKYSFDEFQEYEISPAMWEAIEIFEETIFPMQKDAFLKGDYGYSNGVYPFADDLSYHVISSNIFENGDILFAISPINAKDIPAIIEKYFLGVTIASVIICMILSVTFSYVVSKPLIKMNDAARKMSDLDFDIKLDVKGRDEFSQLSESINTLSDKLDSTLRDLVFANEQLQADIDKEKELEQSRKEFVSNVSHELKTPIAIIKGYSEAIKDNIMESKKEHYIQQIGIQADHMDQLVRDMLALSKIESNGYNLHSERFNLRSLAEETLEQYIITAEEKHITLNFFSDFDVLNICADKLKIGQVISNYLDNAIRHTPEKGSVTLKIDLKENNEIEVSVENHGEPIPEEEIAKVWNRFYRGSEARNKKSAGTGLGLAICAKILDYHNMKYGAYNTDNGVMFYFIVGR